MPKGPIIRAYRNGSYGPPLVNQKYAPLDKFNWTETDEKFCTSLFRYRMYLLRITGLLPQSLTLVTPDWQAAIAAEAGKHPPLVVVSTNRSKWIKKAFDAIKGNAFENPSDLEALTDYGDKMISPPIYCPARLGNAGARNVYIVVNTSEYDEYKTRLAGAGVTIIGWSFRKPAASPLRLSGFGPSRFAAIEFCKTLRTEAGEPWNYAWLFDDNVIALTSFAGYLKVEEAMADADPERICAGFSGGTEAEAVPALRKWARTEIGARRGKQEKDLKVPIDKGLLQQAVLWNISYLAREHLNFAPMFLESGEDVSMGHYFKRRSIHYFFYAGIGIRKEDTGPDNTTGSRKYKEARTELIDWVTMGEASNPTAPPARQPPPVKIHPLLSKEDEEKHRDGSEQTLENFIVMSVLPNAQASIQAQARNQATQNSAKCQAVEQTICKALEAGHIHEPAKDNPVEAAFKVNGAKPQTVVRIDKP